jgi:hypothetical protein
MRMMTALTMMTLLCTGFAFAQTGAHTDSWNGVSLPGLKAELRAGMSSDQLKAALLPQISMSGNTVKGVGIFSGEVPLEDGMYALTLGLKGDRLVMIGLATMDSTGNATDTRLRAWFDKHVNGPRSMYHYKDTDNQDNVRENWTAPGVHWTRGVSRTAGGRKVPMYMVEFVPGE